MTSSHHGPYAQGYTRATMGGTEGSEPVRGSKSQKAALSTDRGLQLDPVKPESLVTADQHAAVNTFPGLVHTARHTTGAGSARSRYPNPRKGEGGADGRAGDWGEVVTRYPYRKVGMDHLLSKESECTDSSN